MSAIKRRAMQTADARRSAARLGRLAREGVDIFCWCNRCGHNAVLESAALAAELGPEMPVPDIGAHLRCSGCGCKDVASRPSWPSPGRVAGHD
ncbi:MAG: hypothetical protein R3316_10595 [Rhodovibrionaceae bacterium]|nr:hypothetical protein [Rhodovibrionaceae bacterium]